MSHPVPARTPASCHQRPTAVVLGAGIAGLTAAHELVERGFDVTVYEPRADERAELAPAPPGGFPPVKLGGLAASQYSTVGHAGGSQAELRPFPGRRGRPRPPERAVAGEHGFRFFPAYYLHIWDLLQRIPLYQAAARETGWHASSRTVMDNVRRVITQATILHGKPSLIFPREQPRTAAELLTVIGQLREFGFTSADVLTFGSRIFRYLVTSPLRRATELQNLSAYDFFIGRDATVARRYSYSPQTEALIFDMPKVLAAFDSRWGDARTNITTFLQLLLRMDRRDDKADGVLNGPTTESWFDHWYRHLVQLGVRFVPGAAAGLEPPAVDRRQPPHLRPRVRVVLADGTRLSPDYVVAAVDAPAAERITGALRAAGTGGAVADLDGFATSMPPDDGPLQPAAERSTARRDPFVMSQMGRRPWDRFQTLAGIQYYFDTEFQLVRGHVFYAGTDWGLSSIGQHGLWERRPNLSRDGYVSVLSVDIGDFNQPSRHLVDARGRGKAARDCTPDELAAEVWRQIVAAIVSNVAERPEAVVPWPVWYALDRNLVMAGPGQGDSRPLRNEAPYLIPIVGDWPNRPGSEPWNPNGTSWTVRPTEDTWRQDLDRRGVWQARHGGYQIHHNSLVFAGTWTKTFTRMTTMEAACESARHAVNAILDHYLWVESGGVDRREGIGLDWRLPFGFLDQGFSVPIRQPSPAGDYCFVFDIENRETLETRSLRNLDSQYCRAALPHPFDAHPPPPSTGGRSMTTPNDYTGQLLAHLQAWRQYLEQAAAPGAGVWGSVVWPWFQTPTQQMPAPQVPMPQMPMPQVPMPQVPMPQVPMPQVPMPQVPLTPPMPPWPATPTAPPPGGPPYPASPGAAPPGPPVPPTADPPQPDTAAASSSPAADDPPYRREPDSGRDTGSRTPASGGTAPYTVAPTGESEDPAGGPHPGSAYPWVEQPAAEPEAATGPASLYSEPGAAASPMAWWEGVGGEYESVPPREASLDVSNRARPRDPRDGVRREEYRRPVNEGGSFRPPGPGLRLPESLSPRPVQFRPPGRFELFGADPRI